MIPAAIRKLEVSRLLAFKHLSIEFSPGITVLIGENSTGKTHVLKLAYGLLQSLREYQQSPALPEKPVKPHVTRKLLGLFRPDDDQIGRLVHRSIGRATGSAVLRFGDPGRFRITISTIGKVTRTFVGDPPPAIYIPSREMLSVYPGFAAAYENRELSFDETHYDLCKALSAAQLRGPKAEKVTTLIDPLLEVLGGRVALKGARFVLHSKEGHIEATLLSEGFRKIGALAQLIANGSLGKSSVLFWDEPEANLNPKLVTVVSGMLQKLAQQGVQVIVATHDFLLSQELSLAAEYPKPDTVPIRFIAFSRTGSGGSIETQSADTLVGLSDNPILAEFAAHYDREQTLAATSSAKAESTRGPR